MESEIKDLQRKCELLKALHVPGEPLVLPNAWDVGDRPDGGRGRASRGGDDQHAGSPPALGFADHEGAPSEEMLAAAGRICGGVEVPVTVDAEAGYGLDADRASSRPCGGSAPPAATSRTPTTPPGDSGTRRDQAEWIARRPLRRDRRRAIRW